MSAIYATRPLGTGLDTAVQAISRAQDRFSGASAQIAREGVSRSEPSGARETQKPKPLAQTPPNPGPPGGARPADLAEAMVNQNMAVHDLAANVKVVQAFDAMLAELSRIKKPD
jgi:hypothetical protein